LSYRDNNELFAGVPEQSLHKYASLLTKEGWTVVVVNQIKNIQNKVVERKVSHILSPGTHIESFTSDSSFLATLYLEENQYTNDAPKFSISAVDVSTGRCLSFSGKLEGKYDSWNFIAGTILTMNIKIISHIYNNNINEVYDKMNVDNSIDIAWIDAIKFKKLKNKDCFNDLYYRKIYGKSILSDFMIEHTFERIIGLISKHYKLQTITI
jgi:hypothetical protein